MLEKIGVSEAIMKRQYPIIEASTKRWIISYILIILSIVFAGIIMGIVMGIFEIEANILLTSIIISTIAVLATFIIDKKFIAKIFQPLKKKDILYIVVGFVISFIFIIIGSIVAGKMGIEVNENPLFDIIHDVNIQVFFASTWIQFIMEELIFVVPFLFVINKFKKINYNLRVVTALLLSSLIFGAMHITTYNNIMQALVLITIIRIGVTISYMLSKNLTVAYIVHGLYDWALIYIALNVDKLVSL